VPGRDERERREGEEVGREDGVKGELDLF